MGRLRDRASLRPSGTGHLGRWSVVVAVVAALAAATGIPARATYGARTSGDEPQYLLTALSLGRDGDLDISDELAEEAYRPFHEMPVDPQTTPLDDGRQVSPHDPLLPLLLAAPMAAGGWVAAKAALAGVAGAVAALALWVAVRRFAVHPAVGALVVGAASLSLPVAGYGSQVYPELPAALVVLAVFAAVIAPRPRARAVALAVVGLIVLPWLSVKYAPVGAVLGLGLLLRLRHDRWRLGWSVAVLAAAAVAYVWLHQWIYGGWTVYAAGDHFADTGELAVIGTEVDLLGRSRRLTGLLTDRSFGIGAWAPVWFGLPVAVGAVLRRRPAGGSLLVAVVAAGWVNATFVALTMHGWWVPGRQLVVVLPLAAVAVAWLVDRARGPVPAAAVALAGVAGAANWLWLAVEAATDRRTLIVDFAATAAPPHRLLRPLLPDGMASGTGHVALHVVWATVVVALLAAGWWRAARRPAAVPLASPPAGREPAGTSG